MPLMQNRSLSNVTGQDLQYSEKKRLEKLFGMRFSRLNIDEEYVYNLAYLLKNPACGKMFQFDGKSFDNYWKPILNGVHSADFTKHSNGIISMHDSRLILDDEKPEKHPSENKFEEMHVTPKPDIHGYVRKNSFPLILNSKNRQNFIASGISSEKMNVNISDRDSTRRVFADNIDYNNSRMGKILPPAIQVYFSQTPSRVFPKKVNPDLSSNSCKGKASTISNGYYLNKSKSTCDNSKQSDKTDKNTSENGCNESQTVSSRVEALIAHIHLKNIMRTQHVSSETSSLKDTESIKDYPNETRADNIYRAKLRRASTFTNGQAKRVPEFQATEYCFSCCKRIYPVDRISIEERIYHKSCFKCTTCQRPVLPGTFACLDGIILCKPHYIEQFRRNGRYEVKSSFVKDEHTENSGCANPLSEKC